MRIGKSILALASAAIFAVGCSASDTKPPDAAPGTTTSDGKKGNSVSGAPVGSLNPNYHSNAAADDSKVGSAMKGDK